MAKRVTDSAQAMGSDQAWLLEIDGGFDSFKTDVRHRTSVDPHCPR